MKNSTNIKINIEIPMSKCDPPHPENRSRTFIDIVFNNT
jgi:hypothetical protein